MRGNFSQSVGKADFSRRSSRSGRSAAQIIFHARFLAKGRLLPLTLQRRGKARLPKAQESLPTARPLGDRYYAQSYALYSHVSPGRPSEAS